MPQQQGSLWVELRHCKYCNCRTIKAPPGDLHIGSPQPSVITSVLHCRRTITHTMEHPKCLCLIPSGSNGCTPPPWRTAHRRWAPQKQPAQSALPGLGLGFYYESQTNEAPAQLFIGARHVALLANPVLLMVIGTSHALQRAAGSSKHTDHSMLPGSEQGRQQAWRTHRQTGGSASGHKFPPVCVAVQQRRKSLGPLPAPLAALRRLARAGAPPLPQPAAEAVMQQGLRCCVVPCIHPGLPMPVAVPPASPLQRSSAVRRCLARLHMAARQQRLVQRTVGVRHSCSPALPPAAGWQAVPPLAQRCAGVCQTQLIGFRLFCRGSAQFCVIR